MFNKVAMGNLPSRIAALITTVMIVTGAVDTLLLKLQNRQMVVQGGHHKYFFHPYIQTLYIFLAECIAYLAYRIIGKLRKTPAYKRVYVDKQGNQKRYSLLWFAVSPVIGCFIDSMMSIALNFINPSIYQMVRGGSIATTFLFSIIILHKQVRCSQVIGSTLALLGIIVVGAASLLWGQSGQSSQSAVKLTQLIGYFLLVAAVVLRSFTNTFEQMLFIKFDPPPIQLMGRQGIFGLLSITLMIVVLSFIQCSFGTKACVFSADGNPTLQNPIQYFRQLRDNGVLMLICMATLASIMVYNLSRVSVVKHLSALAQALGDATKALLVWGVGIIVTVTAGTNHHNYRWENLQFKAIALELAGFVLLIAGNLVYHQIISVSRFSSSTVNLQGVSSTTTTLIEHQDQ